MKKPSRAKPKSTMGKTVAASAEGWDHWWNRSPIMMVDEFGQYVARPGAEFWFKNFWEPRRLSAWAYELVRRLIKLNLKEPKLSAEDQALLRSLPPYPHLTSTQQKILAAVLASQFQEHRPMTMQGTTEAWRQGQIFKLGDWRQIEALDKPANAEGDNVRKLACNYLRRYWELVRGAWIIMQLGTQILCAEPRPQHQLSGCDFTDARIRKVLETIRKRAGHRPGADD